MSAVLPATRRVRFLPRDGLTWFGVACAGLFCLLAVVGPLVSGDPNAAGPDVLAAPSPAHPFGTDQLGRDLFARTAAGTQVSLAVSLAAVALGLLLALPLGILAGYHGGRLLDDLIMRVLEIVQALPMFVLAMFVIGLSGTATAHLGPIPITMTTKVVLLLGAAFVPYFARVARAATMAETGQEYVSALRVVGVPRVRILFGELLPNVAPAMLVQAFLAMALAIFAEGGLGFLGLGVQLPQATLGNLTGGGTGYLPAGIWWYSVLPGAIMLAGILGFNLIGDALSDSLSGRGTTHVETR
ncbi:ABC transporter permease [Microtetraspora sp. NBRC 16547]|uniref:ABC transporter permease n=1 Tax=Microtetraspora sp. NBRC 16547 TaxID=3030993 RepID=UPI0024A34368|nr:ABC transporter permease [Microtetraspora sp. NBRC 16547]GLX02563.1 ABC transporter permease [Microtetraspora sp. NBRC 16547]